MKLGMIENIAAPLGQGVRRITLAAALAVCVSIPSVAQQAERTDTAIETDIVNNLNASPTLRNQQITAATIGGDVTLSGTVRDEASKELAEMAVSRIAGVKSVQNHLSVGQGSSPAPVPQEAPQQTQQPEQPEQPMDQPMGAPNDEPAGSPTDQGAPDGSMPPPPQQGSAPGYPSAPPSYVPPADNSANYAPHGPVVVPQGTLLTLRTSEPLDSKHTQPGTMIEFASATDIYAGGALAIPRGAVLEGQVVDAQNAGSVSGSPTVSLKLNTLVLEGRTYVVNSDTWTAKGPGKGGYTAGNTVAGAAIGAVIGAVAGGGPGAAIGAAAGGATGVAASAATTGPRVILPAETQVTFHLANAMTVEPVSPQEAQRLASSQGGPYMHSRQAYGNGYGYGGYGYPPPPPPAVVYASPYPYYYYYPYRGYYYRGYYYRR
jgi:BON domain